MEKDAWNDWLENYRSASQEGRARMWEALYPEQRKHASTALGIDGPKSVSRRWLAGCGIAAAIFVAVLFFIVTTGQKVRDFGGSPKPAQPATQQEAQPEAPPQWGTVKEWSGSGIKTTETFTIRDRQWRIHWTGSDLIQIFVYTESGDMAGLAANVVNGGSDVSYQRGAGDYYLTINASGTWRVKVEETR